MNKSPRSPKKPDRKFTQAQLDKAVYAAITASKIQDALSLSRWNGSRLDGAQEILRAANITKAEIRKAVDDRNDRRKLFELL